MEVDAAVTTRDAPQHMQALQLANRVRLARADIKRRVATAQLDASEVVLACPWIQLSWVPTPSVPKTTLHASRRLRSASSADSYGPNAAQTVIARRRVLALGDRMVTKYTSGATATKTQASIIGLTVVGTASAFRSPPVV